MAAVYLSGWVYLSAEVGCCRAEHFVLFLRRFVEYLKTRAATTAVVSQSCSAFLADIAAGVDVDGKTLRFCYDRLSSLMKTLELHNTDEYWPIQVCSPLHLYR